MRNEIHRDLWRRFIRWPRTSLVVMVLAAALPGLFLCRAQAADPGCSTLDVRGDQVTMCRDDFGRPHVFADTNRGLFEAYGYVVAQDRLWQLELSRRAARGRLAELFGPGSIPADTVARVTGYTDAELDAQFDSLDPEIQEIFIAFRDGINRYVNEVVAADPLNQLPFEFHALGIGLPAPWSLRDSVAFGGFMVRRFGEIGGRELTNQTVLNALIARHGQADGYAIFNDLRWINDPDAPVTVPADESRAAHLARETSRRTASLNSAQLVGASENWSNIVDPDEALRIWQSLGVPTKLGSYAWVVSPEQSFEGGAMLYGGPQMGFSAPEVLHEVQLTGGNGFNVTGMAFAGIPAVLIGRNDQIAWTSTTATGDNVDTYIETLCDNGNGYVFDGACIAFEERFETIIVRGADPLPLLVRRSVHGPVVSESPGFRATQKRAHWMRELETAAPFLTFDRAANLEEFDAAVRQVVTSHNFLYADQQGNIAYWQAGQVPLRPEGFDLRLPLPGDGSAEWPGGILAVPGSINPARGWLANWNNKPSVDYNNADSQIFGKQFRVLDIADRLSPGPISLEDMRDIPKDIARVGSLGREARFLKPYLIDALDAVPPSHPLAAQARAVLEAWRGDAFTEAVTSTTLEPGQVIFSAWLDRVLNLTFADELGSQIGEAGTNLLIHVLDDALDGGSSVPPSRDYFNGEDPNVIISRAFDQALTALGPNPAAWSAVPRGNITFTHPLIGAVGSIPNSNRSTYGQIILLTQPEIQSENIFTLGQSGFIRLVPPSGFALDSNFRDQLDIFRLFQYKPMLLLPGPDAKK